jgi:ribosomal protein L23
MLRKILLTEKNTKKKGVYCFLFDKKDSKSEIKYYIESFYNVKVKDVNTSNGFREKKYFRNKFGTTKGVTSIFKKANVNLKEGFSINFFKSEE